MKGKYTRFLLFAAAILLAVVLIVNFGLNFWLKKNLPDLIKKNSDYIVNYHTLDINVYTGDIVATGLSINSSNPDNTNIIGLQGTVDTLAVGRLGIYDLLVKKNISTTSLRLVKPKLNIVLVKPVDDRTKKERNPVGFKNIEITQGAIDIFKHTGQKFLGVDDLNLKVKNLKMTEKSVEQKLPFVFDHYDISGTDFFFRPDNLYRYTAKKITTTNGQMKILDVVVKPLLSYKNFRRFYPKKNVLFDFTSPEIIFKDLQFKKEKLAMSDARVLRPHMIIHTTGAKKNDKKKNSGSDIELENVRLTDAKVEVRKDGKETFSAEKLSVEINRFLINDDTANRSLPFNYDDFRVAGSNFNFNSGQQNVAVQRLSLTPKSLSLKEISVKSTSGSANSLDMAVKQLKVTLNDWKFNKDKLKLDVEEVLAEGLTAKIITGAKEKKQRPTFAGIEFPLRVKKVSVTAPALTIVTKNRPIAMRDIRLTAANLEMDERTIRDKIPFSNGDYQLTARALNYNTQYYRISSGLIKINKNQFDLADFAMKPTVSRAQFIRSIPAEKDLYTLAAKKIRGEGSWDVLSERKFLDLKSVIIDNADANIFRSKIPKDDETVKPMYSQLLRSIKFPVFVQDLNIRNSLLVYEEDTKKSDGPGKLSFNNFNLAAKNINSGKDKNRATQIPITITCRFMNASPMNVRWTLDTARQDDGFSIAGNITDLPAERINPFIEPYLKIQATGVISDLIFDFKGNKTGLGGVLKMVHKDLKIALLKETGDKNQILSAIANIFVKTDSGNFPASVQVEGVERDATKSFFNLFWRGIEQGLKKTLIGGGAPKTEQSVRKTVENTKTALEQNKKELKETKEEIKTKLKPDVEKKPEKEAEKEAEKEGFFKRLFKKKSGS